jgi:hypothetical protein
MELRKGTRASRKPHAGSVLSPNQSDMRPHFGLGDATVAEVVRIEWPSEIVQELSNVKAGQNLKVIEPPRLSIRSAGTTGMLSWPARAEGYPLYQAASPDGPWEPVDAADHPLQFLVEGYTLAGPASGNFRGPRTISSSFLGWGSAEPRQRALTSSTL